MQNGVLAATGCHSISIGRNRRRLRRFPPLFFFLSPRRRSGEKTEERGPSSPQPSPPSDGGEGVFGCASAALRSKVLRQRPARDRRNAAISWPLRTSKTSPTSTGWFQVLPLIAGNRASSVNWSEVAPTSASSPASASTSS